MGKQQVERRIALSSDAQLRLAGEEGSKRKIMGYGAVFNRESVDLGGFVEIIAPGAFREAIAKGDCRCLKNHDANLILGRQSNKSLILREDSLGLFFECDVPNTSVGRDAAEEVRRGDLCGCSFSFTVAPGGDSFDDRAGKLVRTITKVKQLFDVGPVVYPAYPDTSVSAKGQEAKGAKPPTPLLDAARARMAEAKRKGAAAGSTPRLDRVRAELAALKKADEIAKPRGHNDERRKELAAAILAAAETPAEKRKRYEVLSGKLIRQIAALNSKAEEQYQRGQFARATAFTREKETLEAKLAALIANHRND